MENNKNKKKLIIGILIFFVILIGIGAYVIIKNNFKKEEKPKINLVQVLTTEGIALAVPEGFETKSSQFMKEFYVKDDAKIFLTSQETQNDLDNYVNYAINEYKGITEFYEEKENYYVEFSGLKSKVVEFSYSVKSSDGIVSLSCFAAYIIEKGKAYILTCTSSPETFEDNKIGFEETLKSIRIE